MQLSLREFEVERLCGWRSVQGLLEVSGILESEGRRDSLESRWRLSVCERGDCPPQGGLCVAREASSCSVAVPLNPPQWTQCRRGCFCSFQFFRAFLTRCLHGFQFLLPLMGAHKLQSTGEVAEFHSASSPTRRGVERPKPSCPGDSVRSCSAGGVFSLLLSGSQGFSPGM